jgi:hypothetical protein
VTDKALPHVANAPEINVKANIDGAAIQAFLTGLFTNWEKGRQPYAGENGAACTTCDPANWSEIWQATANFVLGIVKNTIEGTAPTIGTAYFTEGAKAGADAAAKQLKVAPAKLPAMAPRVLDTDVLVKSIGEEIRKAFEAGQASGKGTASEAVPRVASARQTVQRNQHTGEIMATVVNYQYDDAPGIQPPPL